VEVTLKSIKKVSFEKLRKEVDM